MEAAVIPFAERQTKKMKVKKAQNILNNPFVASEQNPWGEHHCWS